MIRVIMLTSVTVGALLSGGTALAGLVADDQPSGAGWVKPVQGAVVSQGFGCTDVVIEPPAPACPGRHWHSGIDLAAPRSTPVRAALPGFAQVIVSATGYGLHVIVDDGGGVSTLYGHLDRVDITTGQYVDAGEVMGAVGSTGNSTGPHLHFEVRRDGIAEDPRNDIALP